MLIVDNFSGGEGDVNADSAELVEQVVGKLEADIVVIARFTPRADVEIQRAFSEPGKEDDGCRVCGQFRFFLHQPENDFPHLIQIAGVIHAEVKVAAPQLISRHVDHRVLDERFTGNAYQ